MDGSVKVYVNHVRSSCIYALGSMCSISGNCTYTNGSDVEILSNYGLYDSIAGGDVTLDMYGIKDLTTTNQCNVKGISNSSSDNHILVGGNYTFNYKGGKAYYLYGVDGSDKNSIQGNVEIHVEGGIINYLQGIDNCYVEKDYSLDVSKDSSILTQLYVTQYSEVKGDLTSNVCNGNTSSNLAYYYGVYYTNVLGNVTSVIDGGYYTYFYGIYSGNNYSVTGNADVTVKNVNKDIAATATSYYSYGINGTTIGGNVNVDISDSNLYSVNGTQYIACGSSITVNISNVGSYYYIYGANVTAVAGDIECNISKVNARYLYGVYLDGGNCGGTVNCTLDTLTVTEQLYGVYGYSKTIAEDVTVTLKDSTVTYGYLTSNIQVGGNVKVDINGGTYGSASSGYLYGCSGTTADGAIDISMSKAMVIGFLYPYSNYGNTSTNNITVDIEKTTVVDASNSTAVISNTIGQGQTLDMTIAEDCQLSDNITINPSTSGYGYATASYNGAKYYSGYITFDENVTEDTVYLMGGYYYIPKGVTVKVNKALYYKGGSLLLEGAFDAPFAGATNDNGVYANTTIYMNGGTMTQDLTTMNVLYYPINVNYLEKGGTVKFTANYITHPLGGEQYYACVGTVAKFTATANEGYSITAATVTAEGEETPSDITLSSGVYSFTMTNKPTEVNITFTGDPIVLGKTVADPIVKSGQEYTEESPVYDLSTVSISNDSTEGEVTYAVDETNGLPTGLQLVGGKIYGTTTEINETGKKTVILVTGKNGNVVELVLNIVVTAGEGTQTSQEGRIVVDDTNKMVYLSGNSVILEASDAGTAIYLDDDKNGVADYDTPAYSGDLSSYTVYGVRNTNYSSTVRITMNGGSVEKIYGVHNSTLTSTALALEFYMNGGTVGEFYGLSGATIKGTAKLVVAEAATVNSYIVTTGTCSCKGYYSDNKGAVTINGTYAMTEGITATSVTMNSSSNVSVKGDIKASTVTMDRSSTVEITGTISATTMIVNSYSDVTMNGVVNTGTLTVNAYSVAEFNGTVTASKDINLYSAKGITFYKPVSTEATLLMQSAVVTFYDTVSAVDLLVNNSGTTVTFKKNVTVSDEMKSYGTIHVNSGVTVTVSTKMYLYANSKTYVSGSLQPAALYNYNNYVYVLDGGTLAESLTWSYAYYPVTTSAGINKASISFTPYSTVVVNGASVVFLRGGASITATTTAVQGYTYKFKIGDCDAVASETNSYTFTMPKAATAISTSYVPMQITAEKRFAEPVGVVGTEYTATQPLYDLTDLIIYNDTTTAYGTDMTYAVASGSTLPAGLSLVDGKVVGTPETENKEGAVVSFVITGRNGSSTTLDVTFTIEAADYAPVNINDDVKATYSFIQLNGHSVVIYGDLTDSNKCTIYPDYNRDKIADNNIPLKINESTVYSLGSCVIYGYNDQETPYEGDISITLLGGKVKSIYGAYGTSTAKTEVNGTVGVYIQGGTITSTARGANYADVDNVEFEVTGGTHTSIYLYGAYNSIINKNLDLVCGGTAILKGGSYSSTGVYVYAAANSEIAGDVNTTLGADNSAYGFSGNYTYYYGPSATKVAGSVNNTFDGYWYPKQYTRLVNGGTVAKDINVTLKSGSIYKVYCAQGTAISGNIDVKATDDSTASVSELYGLYNATAKSVDIYVPKGTGATISSLTLLYGTSTVEKCAYAYNKGYITIDGEYAFSEDITAYTLNVLENAKVTIMEGVTVALNSNASYVREGATLVNEGTATLQYIYNYGTITNNGTMTSYYADNFGDMDNYGSLKTTGSAYMRSGCQMTNHENATWTVGGRLYNSDTIYNYGDFIQTYGSSYYYTLGTIYSTTKLTLSKESSNASTYTSNSTIYYPVALNYPSHCVETVELTSDYTSSIEGDDSKYIKAGTSFTVKPSETLSQSVVLDSVTYGSGAVTATKQSDGTWVGTVPLEPFTVSLNYVPAENVEDITLGKTEDRIENTEDSTPLIVNKYYSTSSPLYDLASIEIIGDTEEDGEVTYSLDSSSTLPDGMYLKNGKLYGTIKTATTKDQKITFVIKGKNQTSAFFTLTLGPVKQYVPSWSVPTNLQASTGETFGDVYIPSSSYGTYSWPDADATVGDTITTLTDQTLYFTPNDIANYDWATVAENTGATYSNGRITCKVSIQVYAGKPTYTVPETVTATYGQTYGEVEIPAGDNEGTFSWMYDSSTKVGSVGTYYRYVTYTPKDTDQYQTVSRIKVTLIVKKAVPTYEKVESLTSACGVTLADITLPTVEGGYYHWITTASTLAEDGKTYQLGFKPTDTSNYDWTALEDGTWNTAWGSAVFPVVVNLTHSPEEAWSYDATYHWHECPVEKCGADLDKAIHHWDAGTVVKAATDTAAGTMKYTCACGATKIETIPMLAHTKHIYQTTWSYDEDSHWHACTNITCDETKDEADHVFDAGVVVVEATEDEEGTKKYTCKTCGYSYTEEYDIELGESDEPLEVDEEFEDKASGATYVVTSDTEIGFVETTDSSVTELQIPETITFGGRTYQVTSIADEAFKNHKSLKKVTIGSNIKTIGKKAFYGCKKLTTVTIGKNVTSIGDGAFQNCTALKKITIPAKVTKIGNKAFYGCKQLATVSLGSGLTTIGTSAFQNCTALKKITIPAKVTKIGAKAFYGCKKLTNITIKTTKLNTKNVGKQAFTKAGSSNYKKLTVKVPKKKLKAYKAMLKKRGLNSKAKVK